MAPLVLLRILVVVLLVALNAFFVAAEFAIVSVRDTRIQQLIDARRVGARTVQRLQQRLDDFLPAVQFGVTLASLALGWIGEPAVAQLLLRPLAGLPHAVVYAHTGAVIIAFVLITYFHVILGELVPKSLALQRAEQVALSVAGPMDVFITISRPLLHLMTRSANAVLRLFGSRLMREGGMHSPEELKLILTSSRRLGLLPPLQEEIMHRALELENMTVREILVPRQNIFSLPADMTLEDAMARVVEDQHSRIPVYDPALGKEHIVGMLYSKDLSRFMHLRISARARPLPPEVTLRVRHIMRDVLVVPETKPVIDLLAEFRQRKRHLAIVVDEYGSTVGLVTVEDALEQIVGEIEDEFDVTVQPHLLDTGALVLEGGANVRDLESHLRIRLPRDEGFETLGGFIMWRLGRLPQTGDSVEFEARRYTVLQMYDRRVLQVKVEALSTPEPQAEEQPSLFHES
ncbi:MAG: HlyC/CorC family transporter [Acidobacteria bacterium]|nr:MAG: HlyC/CorC family transporter [Acidobacteriota bacterium]